MAHHSVTNSDHHPLSLAQHRDSQSEPPVPLARLFAQAATHLPELDDAGFADWIDHYANARVVLLGEASHGTAEFYRARTRLTQRLISEHGFTVVAVEADWPDAAAIDRYVRHRSAPPASAGPNFSRFPTWMWRNTEVAALVDWMRDFNVQRNPAERAGFFGLDIYSLSASMAAVLAYLERVDPAEAALARRRYACLVPWQSQPARYGHAVLSATASACEDEVIAQLRALLEKRIEYALGDHDAFFEAAQNARLVASAEQYYRAMYQASEASWNLRDTHMHDTLTRLLEAWGPGCRAVVWAHNSHIGDASATTMGTEHNQLNLGQLCRRSMGSRAALIGLDTYTGTVAAASTWDGPMRIKKVLPARADSYEYVAHAAGLPRAFVDLRDGVAGAAAALRDALLEPLRERFIGVIYQPETELHSHYMHAVLPYQFDGWLWLDTTTAVRPLAAPPAARTAGDMPDTYPFGL
jgi:erythromycin esterase-like protein